MDTLNTLPEIIEKAKLWNQVQGPSFIWNTSFWEAASFIDLSSRGITEQFEKEMTTPYKQMLAEFGQTMAPTKTPTPAPTLHVSYNNEMSFDEANEYCAKRTDPPMQMISIHSAAENEKVKEACGGIGCWLGLEVHDSSHKNWMWTDQSGSLQDYSNWHPGEPNNLRGHEDVAYMAPDGQWADLTNANHQFLAVCSECGGDTGILC